MQENIYAFCCSHLMLCVCILVSYAFSCAFSFAQCKWVLCTLAHMPFCSWCIQYIDAVVLMKNRFFFYDILQINHFMSEQNAKKKKPNSMHWKNQNCLVHSNRNHEIYIFTCNTICFISIDIIHLFRCYWNSSFFSVDFKLSVSPQIDFRHLILWQWIKFRWKKLWKFFSISVRQCM